MILALLGGKPVDGASAASRIFRSEKYHYTARCPKGWQADRAARPGILDIDNFAPATAVRAVHVPPGGAEIDLFPLEALIRRRTPGTLDEWVDSDAKLAKVISRRRLEVDRPDGKLSVIELKQQCCAVPPFSEDVNWYFMLNGRVFRAHLTYWKGDPKQVSLEHTMEQVVASVEALSRH